MAVQLYSDTQLALQVGSGLFRHKEIANIGWQKKYIKSKSESLDSILSLNSFFFATRNGNTK